MPHTLRVILPLSMLITAYLLAPAPLAAKPMHGISMHGELGLGPDFDHLNYVNPNAPTGGKLVYGAVSGYDSLNPFNIKGRHAPNLRPYVFESLMTRAYDEPFSLYGLLAKSVETAADRSWVAFTLNENARFSDGRPVSVDDVIHSHSLLRDFGRPNHREYYSKVVRVEKTGPLTVKFSFDPQKPNRELPLIMGLMPVLPKHIYDQETFQKTSLKPPVGSGPYIVDRIKPSESLSFRRNEAYWGRDLAINRGRFRLDRITIMFYRDANSLFEDFKKGQHNLLIETDPDRWAKSYDFPAMQDGRITRETVPLAIPAGMNALVFNTRRPKFKDILVRQALTQMFDFEWINRNLFHNLYARTRSYFDRSDLSSADKPADAHERALLSAFANKVPADIMERGYTPPVGDGTGRNRKARRKALKLLKQAGYALQAGHLIDKQTGKPFTFEILTAHRSQSRLFLPYISALKKLGIAARLRVVDSAEFQQRIKTYDFDMIHNEWRVSLSPGNEQTFRWGSRAAKSSGSFNFAGIADPAVDAMIGAILASRTRTDFISSVRALDRVLLSGNYVVPLFHTKGQWIALWNHLKHPENISLYGLRLDTLWQDSDSLNKAD
jgi:peptide/nickel transport system substrate-binding protein